MTDLGLTLNGGALPRVPAGATRDQELSVLNAIVDQLNDALKVQTFSDGSSRRFVTGYAPGRFPTGDFGMAISQPGYDVLTCDPSKLLFSWDFTANTQFWNNTAGENYMQLGTLPDGSDGMNVARPGTTVADAFA